MQQAQAGHEKGGTNKGDKCKGSEGGAGLHSGTGRNAAQLKRGEGKSHEMHRGLIIWPHECCVPRSESSSTELPGSLSGMCQAD